MFVLVDDDTVRGVDSTILLLLLRGCSSSSACFFVGICAVTSRAIELLDGTLFCSFPSSVVVVVVGGGGITATEDDDIFSLDVMNPACSSQFSGMTRSIPDKSSS